jgi:hypothetical protein
VLSIKPRRLSAGLLGAVMWPGAFEAFALLGYARRSRPRGSLPDVLSGLRLLRACMTYNLNERVMQIHIESPVAQQL